MGGQISTYFGPASLLVGLTVCSLEAQTGPVSMMNHAPVWAPTQNLIVFDSDRGGHGAVYTIAPDDGTVRQISGDGRVACCGRWIADGTAILFEADSGGVRHTYRVLPDGTGLQRAMDGASENRSVASDGTAAMVMIAGGVSNVYLVSPGGSRTQLTHGNWASQPSFSPDGQRIVYENRTGEDVASSEIVVISRDGSDQRALARGTDPSWSPNGSLVLFKTPTTSVGGFGWEIATINPDGSELTRLIPGVHPTWSPDGNRVAYMAETGPQRTDIWVINTDGTGRRCLTCSR